MKRLILFVVAVTFIAAMSYNVGGPKRLSDAKETGNNVIESKAPSTYKPSGLVDTLGSVQGMGGYYDYVTNGNNLHRIWISGDTVIVTGDQTDSVNAQLSTARRSFYQYSFNNGGIWGTGDAILVNPDGNAYPDLHPMIVNGSRTPVLTGRQFVAGARRGYTGVDVQLGAGSFTSTLVPTGAGSDNFGWPVSATEVACAWLGGGTADSIYFAKYNTSTNTYGPVSVLFTGVPANARQYCASNGSGKVAVGYWFATAPTKLVYKESTDGGSSFGSEQTAFSEGTIVNGTPVAPWFNADMIYSPTGNLCWAFGTLLTGNFGTAGGYKLMFYNPTINGGTAVKVVDHANYLPMADTNVFNNSLRNIQVGMTAMSHPSLAYSSDGSRLFVVYSGVQLDTVNSTSYSGDGSYNYSDIYVQYSDDNGATWSSPRNLTNTAALDEIYPSVSVTGNTPTAISITYQLSECPGSTSFTNTTTPTCPVWQIYRKYNPETGGIIGISNISNEVPNGFSLKQNYPNPFNPNTKIRFSVPKASNVSLLVYDVTGKLVATLANNQAVTAGVKEVEFSASNLASGIYFYTLKAGEFTETKKMILVK